MIGGSPGGPEYRSGSSALRRTLPFFAGVSALFAITQAFWLISGAVRISIGRDGSTAAVAVAGLLAFLFATRFHQSAGKLVEDRDDGRSPEVIPCVFAAASLLWILWVWGNLWGIALLRPPYDWDGLYYHLPAINSWAVNGHIGWVAESPDVPFVNYPMGIETTTFIASRILGTSSLVNGCNLWYWPHAFLSLVVMASLLGARAVWSFWAGSLIVSAPVLICQSLTCYSDPGLAATVMGSMAATMLLIFGRSYPYSWRALLWGANLGLLAGAKGTGAPLAVIVAAVTLVALIVQHRGVKCRSWLLPLGPAALIALACGGVWYIRNAIVTGNPFHPVQIKFGARLLFPGYDHLAMLEANLPAWLAAYPRVLRTPVSWLQLDAPVQGYAPTGGLGYLWVAVCVPALLFLGLRLLRRRPSGKDWPFLLAASLSVIMLLSTAASWWGRFSVWLLGLGLPSLALLLSSWDTRRAVQKGLSAVCLAGILGLTVWESNRTLQLEQRFGLNPKAAAGEPAYLSTADMIFPGFLETPGIEGFMGESRIARSQWSRMGTLFGGVLSMPLGSRSISILPVTPSGKDLERIRSAGVRWVVWDVVGAGPVPSVLERSAMEVLVHNPTEHVNFRFLKMGFAHPVCSRTHLNGSGQGARGPDRSHRE